VTLLSSFFVPFLLFFLLSCRDFSPFSLFAAVISVPSLHTCFQAKSNEKRKKKKKKPQMCMSTKIKTQENTVIVPSKSVYMNSGFTNPLSFIFFVMI